MKRWVWQRSVSRQLLDDPYAVRMVNEMLAKDSVADVRGPRGGRYQPVGPIEQFSMETTEDWMRNTLTVGVRRAVRYVRPKRVLQ